ncbi:hypothetical protein [Neobacillus sp. PS3-40]|uniref:hypothetical protein n=1 Tax=Neobacillus sp. PS3-40 TaxID=3070679 RepID=UPI0027E084EE|nr:hypothetical protein [Neobacillus sp. PS3-40]WML44060.1 hypothetical protein RCG20_20130 [Neobacillus sp. PS3-40]
MENQKVLKGTAVLNLEVLSEQPELFTKLIKPENIRDAKLTFLTSEFQTITINVNEFLLLSWEATNDEKIQINR